MTSPLFVFVVTIEGISTAQGVYSTLVAAQNAADAWGQENDGPVSYETEEGWDEEAEGCWTLAAEDSVSYTVSGHMLDE